LHFIEIIDSVKLNRTPEEGSRAKV